MPLPRDDERYTYADYLGWPEGERWELIEGAPCDMTPAPSVKHQRLALRLATLLETKLAGSTCTPFIAPTDVVLSEVDVVQPDVFVVCDPARITPTHIRGAPDLVFEVLSPATALKDRRTKRDLYERHGVREYVLADPEARYAEQFVRDDDGRFGPGRLAGPDEVLRLASLEGLEVPLAEVFDLSEPA